MSDTSQASASSSLDTLKLAASLGVLIAGIVAFYWFANEPIYLRVPGLLVAVAIAIGLFVLTERGRVIWSYLQGSRTEVRKMVWPTRKETTQTTLTIFIVVILLGIFLWLLDMALLAGVRTLVGYGD